jgi:hypothetical protein
MSRDPFYSKLEAVLDILTAALVAAFLFALFLTEFGLWSNT